MSACVIIPNGLVAGLFDNELQKSNPKLRFNNVDPEKFANKEKNIHLPDLNPDLPPNAPEQKTHWYPNGSWIEFNNEAKQIKGINPIKRPRRTNYIMDFNSNSFKVLSKSDGLTLRIEFETDGNEMKGWKHTAILKGRRDKGAADGNITAPEDSDYPFVEIDLNHFSISNGKVVIVPPTENDIRVGMGFDGNGFLELIDGLLAPIIRNIIKNEIVSNWSLFAGDLENEIRNSLDLNIQGLGLNLDISDLSFNGDQAHVCLGVNHSNPVINQIFSYFTHVLPDGVKDLTLIGPNAIDGTGNGLDNIIQGNDAINLLKGLSGNDTLLGGLGNDSLDGGTGNDFLDGGLGSDTMFGQLGDDTYVIENFSDKAFEEFNQGIDTVEASIGYVLDNNLEKLVLVGADAIDGGGNDLDNEIVGNELDNIIDGQGGNDTLSGLAGNDSLLGGEGDDYLDGGIGDDLLDGGLDNDVMLGQAGNDTFVVDSVEDEIVERSNEGIDTVRSSITFTIGENLENLILTGNETIDGTGNAVDNNITGNIADNVLLGLGGNDVIDGKGGNDHIEGGAGDDILSGGAGVDYIDGGIGYDIATFEGATTGIILHLGVGRGSIGEAGGDTYVSIEGIFGSEHRDRIIGSQNADGLIGNGGDDLLDGRDGDDTLQGGTGLDDLMGGLGDDSLEGGTDNDFLYGDVGDDFLIGGQGDDWLEGGLGFDTISFEDSPKAILVNLSNEDYSSVPNASSIVPDVSIAALSATDGYGTNDFILDVESVIGSVSNDVFISSQADETFFGREGDDFFVIKGGSNTVDGGDGIDTVDYRNSLTSINLDLAEQIANKATDENDTLMSIENAIGSSFDDIIVGDDGGHTIEGYTGNDTLAGGLGNDEILGGDGDDLLRGDLNRQDTQDEINGGDDILRGGLGNDRMGGKAGNDQLYGDEGDDEIWGGIGDDLLVGGQGKDLLTGLSGADTFLFNSFEEGVDIITDFNGEQGDRIHIMGSGFTNELAIGLLDADSFALGAATGVNAQFIYHQTTGSLFFDSDGSGAQEAVKIAQLSNNTNLGHSDIVIV